MHPRWLTGWAFTLLLSLAFNVIQFGQLNEARRDAAAQRTVAGYWEENHNNLRGAVDRLLLGEMLPELDMRRVNARDFYRDTEQRIIPRYAKLLADLESQGNPGCGVVCDQVMPMLDYIVSASWQPGSNVTRDQAMDALQQMSVYVARIPYSDMDAQRHLAEIKSRFLANQH